MNKKLIPPTIVIVAVLIAVWLYEAPVKEYKKIHGSTQGTTYNITYEYKQGEDLHTEIEQVLRDFDLSLSTYLDESIISKINRNEEGVSPDEKFLTVFHEARRVYEETQGAFDITVAPIVNAFGFGFTPASVVDSALIDSLLQFVGMDKVSLEQGRIVKDDPRLMLDVNAIAQGYSVDVVAAFLEGKKVENYLVEIGGELRCKGKNPKGENWMIGIDRPIDGNMIPGENMQAVVLMENASLATSGNYRKFYEMEGVKYAHSIDPKTGYPILSRLLSATVVTDECIRADALATAFMVMGIEKSIEFLNDHLDVDAYLIYSDSEGNLRVYATKGMRKRILDELPG